MAITDTSDMAANNIASSLLDAFIFFYLSIDSCFDLFSVRDFAFYFFVIAPL